MKKIKVANKIFSFQSLFIINTFIEIESSTTSKYPICKDIVFFEFYKGYDRAESKITMSLDSFELRKLSYACKELYKTGKSDYKNFTDPQLSNNTSSSGKKEITIACKDNVYFLNLTQRNNNDGERKIVFDKYGILSFCDELDLIANETESMLYKCQRMMEKEIKSTSA